MDELLPADAPCTVGGALCSTARFFFGESGADGKAPEPGQTSPPAKPSRLRFLPPAGVGRPLGVYSYVCTLCERAAEPENPQAPTLGSDPIGHRCRPVLILRVADPRKYRAPGNYCVDHLTQLSASIEDQTARSTYPAGPGRIIPVQQSTAAFRLDPASPQFAAPSLLRVKVIRTCRL